jgi:SAM-dependent methyltransferase
LSCLACGADRLSPWAAAVDVEYETSADRFEYLRCDDCGALSIDPVPRGRLAEIYPSNYYSFSDTDASLVARVKRFLDARRYRSLLGELPHQSLRVLDVGGGVGATLTLLQSVDARVVATQVVDIDPSAAEVARQRGHAYALSTIEAWDTDERFELILMLNLVEHVEAPVDVLAKARLLLAPGGRVVVQTPNIDSLDARLFRHRNWGGYHCPRHWVLFDRPSFLGAARRAGLAPISFSYTQGAPFWAVSVLAGLARAGVASVGPDRPAYRHPLYGPLAGAFAGFDFLRAPVAKLSQMVAVLEPLPDQTD